jgi:chromosome segregation ATPase
MVAERIELKNEIHKLQNDLSAALEKAERCEARIAELQDEVQRLLDGAACGVDEPNMMSFDD